jgi:hypothetical protein
MTDRIKYFLPAAILLVIVLGGVVWYMMSTPAPTPNFGTDTPTAVTEPVTVTDEATYYTIKALYPSETPLKASAGAQADQAAVSVMKTFVEQEIARFKDNGDFANLSHDDVQMLGLDQRKYELGIEYQAYAGNATLTYVYQMYMDTGGAHPNAFYRTFTFDSKTGAQLTMHDLFTEGAPYLETLSSISRSKLPAFIAQRGDVAVSEVDTDYIASGTMPEEDAFQNFYFKDGSLVLLFPPYQIGPYVLGMIELPIPVSELPNLRSEYKK